MVNPGDTLSDLLQKQGFVVLDGGLATELERHGCDLNNNLWSADVLLKNPSLIQRVHLDYFLAGADVATTSSYQVSAPGLEKAGLSTIDAANLVRRSVQLAVRARDEAHAKQPNRRRLIAGSIGPYGAFLADGSEYRGDYDLSEDEFKDFHRPRLEALIHAGVDLLAIETIPSFPETLALKAILAEYSTARAWFSFTVRDSSHISDGTSLAKVVDVLGNCEQVAAIGVNCVSSELATDAVKVLAGLTTKPLVVYPNSGESYDASNSSWEDNREQPSDLARLAPEWVHLGAKFIGGCCRTTPKDIRTIRAALESKSLS
jgi:homocysteine S-methyltransferase